MRYLMAAIAVGACASGGFGEARSDDGAVAYEDGPFAFFSLDYFARFTRDPNATPAANEMALDSNWSIGVAEDADPLTALMATDLAEFLRERMDLNLPLRTLTRTDEPAPRTIVLADRNGGHATTAESYTIAVVDDSVAVRGRDPEGLRDGVVRLVDRIGFRAAPILEIGQETGTPRLGLRVGTIPRMGTYRDLVFMGYNGVIVSPTDDKSESELTELSNSKAIPELEPRQKPDLVERLAAKAREARRYGLKTFVALQMWDFYPADAPIFQNHPGLRGALAHYHMGEPPKGHLLCTEDALARRYIGESFQGIFESIPLDGALIIIGGEVFQHCFMRPADVEKGHTNCARCEPLGAETVVANLCNRMADAARKANPEAVVVAWPYSAKHFWSVDDDQVAFIRKLKPGTALLTEIEKDETLHKPGGVAKAIWDYSIDLIGPTDRALRQIAACKESGAAVYLKSEPELAFEAPGVPYIPCVDRWFDRAEALASCGADGAWVIAWFIPNLGNTSAEVYKYAWWNPAPKRDALLEKLAWRITGSKSAAGHLRRAWGHVSEAMEWSPELPPYFSGPYYLGPTHPMCADPDAKLLPPFEAKSEFAAHILTEARGNVEVFGRYYRHMEAAMLKAVKELDAAAPDVEERCLPVFQGEELPARWLYHTARTHANFYESCLIRDSLRAITDGDAMSPEERAAAQARYDRWRAVLQDERQNTADARAVVAQDPRIDVNNTSSGAALEPAADMLNAKLDLLDHELNVYLPSVAVRLGLKPQP